MVPANTAEVVSKLRLLGDKRQIEDPSYWYSAAIDGLNEAADALTAAEARAEAAEARCRELEGALRAVVEDMEQPGDDGGGYRQARAALSPAQSETGA